MRSLTERGGVGCGGVARAGFCGVDDAAEGFIDRKAGWCFLGMLEREHRGWGVGLLSVGSIQALAGDAALLGSVLVSWEAMPPCAMSQDRLLNSEQATVVCEGIQFVVVV